ncbi:hypothetical protein [Nocardia bhagyanarayanae]|uniref:3-oxoacyl-[acyl-carrier-protein] synthase-3 n=1 Tax=Nocardia bhagyanarayanae TaxID=1215925 RepID=A0A543FGF3_9NOCA|nr:hypothetical protein [Nocardia bhagyanarayanae]TQM32948.1 3-oxoacyl-[acyl-carrier-protein] synthase-3 [Nocardia bhagyanarayanae]
MATMIISAATDSDPGTGSYFELAARAARTCVQRADVGLDEIGMLINTGVFRDSNLCEPAVAALIQKRIGLGLAYEAGQTPTFSFDLMQGATGLLHAIVTADAFLATGGVEYALLVAGDVHPSTERHVSDFPYTSGGAALLLGSSPAAGGFGRLHTCEAPGTVDPTAWVDLGDAGTEGRRVISIRAGAQDPVDLAVAVVRSCVDEEGLDGGDFAEGQALLLAPAHVSGFRTRLANTLAIPARSVIGFAPSIGVPYTAAPVYAYLNALDVGLLDTARTVIFLAADGASAACLAYHPRSASRTPGMPATSGRTHSRAATGVR